MSENTITPDTSVLNNLRNIPEDSLRALTLDEFKKFTFEHLLRLQEARDKEVERYNNPVRFLLSEFNAPSVYGNEIGKLQHESAQKIKELNKQIQEYQQNLTADLEVWEKERITDLQKFGSDIQNELNEFNKENVEYQSQLQISIQNTQFKDSSDIRKLNKYSAEIQEYQANVNKEIQEYTLNFQKDLETFRSGITKYTSESQNVASQNTVTISKFSTELNNYNAQIQKYSVDYNWLDSQYKQLSADYQRGLQTLTS